MPCSADELDLRRFQTRPNGDWTDVIALTPVTDKHPYGSIAVISSFGGSDKGKADAERYCDVLNAASEAFFRGNAGQGLETGGN